MPQCIYLAMVKQQPWVAAGRHGGWRFSITNSPFLTMGEFFLCPVEGGAGR